MSLSEFILVCKEGNLEKAQEIYYKLNFNCSDSVVMKISKISDLTHEFHLNFIINEIFRDCCFNGKLNVVKWLYGLGIISLDGIADNLFRWCCINKYLSMAEWLFGVSSININFNCDDAFKYSCFEGNLDIAKWLWSKGIINFHSGEEYVFRWSCWFGRLDVVIWLCGLGDVNVGINNNEAFRWSCANGKLDVAQWIFGIYGGIDLHDMNDYVFHESAKVGHLNIISWLLDMECFPNDLVNKYAAIYDENIISKLYMNNYIAVDSRLIEKFNRFRKKRILYYKRIMRILGRLVVYYFDFCERYYAYGSKGFCLVRENFEIRLKILCAG